MYRDYKTQQSRLQLSNRSEVKPIRGKTKSTIYKSFMRQVLLYGLETIKLRPREIRKIKKIESNTVKISLGLSKSEIWRTNKRSEY